MPFKSLIPVLSLCVSSAFCATLAGNTPAIDQQINKQINYLQTQINELRAEQGIQKKQKQTPSRRAIYTSPLSIGPYFKDATGGSKLIINVPTVREDSRLLLRQYQLTEKCHKLGIPAPDLPQVTLTGKLEGQASYMDTYASSRSGNINFGSAELDTYVQSNSWVSGYMALNYTSDENRDDSRLFMNRAFITIGNLSKFPFYTSIGQVYVPFGRYSSLMVTAPVTQVLGRTRARTLTVGYQQTDNNNGLHAEVYGFQGLTNNNLSHSNQNWGIDIGYEFNNRCHLSGEIGTGYISNLANSQGIQATVFLNTENHLRHRVPALNVYSILAINPVVFLAEYVGAIRSFDANDISFINQRRRPTAFHTEASYTFKTGSKPSSIGVSYGCTSQALALGLPQDCYSIFYNINIWRDTNLALEYRHDVNCAVVNTVPIGYSPTPDVVPANLVTDFKKSDNMITTQFDLFF